MPKGAMVMKVDSNMLIATCTECDRRFDLLNSNDRDELAYGHDCEVS